VEKMLRLQRCCRAGALMRRNFAMDYSPLKAQGIEVLGKVTPEQEAIVTPDALKFVASLHRKFEGTRDTLLKARVARDERLQAGEKPKFLKETEEIRKGDWKVAPIPADLMDRRVEITGPTSAKMVINALNSGASCYMSDFEDSNSPTWYNQLEGQVSLHRAISGNLEFTSPEGKKYVLNKESKTTLMARPRGWHLNEKHLKIDGAICSGSLFDFGLYFYHNHQGLRAKGSGPYFYLPKMESHLEARLWNDVFTYSQNALAVPHGTIRATVLIETILAAFEMDEILYELRDHSAGLNCGRWDYIFSFIKKFRNDPAYGHTPDRSQITMTVPFLKAYVDLLIQTCHKRGVHAMGGMAAQIPIASDPVASEAQMTKVKADKLREVTAGHDGTWVAHPGLIPLAMEIFDKHMPDANQINVKGPQVTVTEEDLIRVPEGDITEEGVKQNVLIGTLYLEAWLNGQGCVPLFNLMEDAATAEISRTQIWSWIKHGASTKSGQKITPEYVKKVVKEEMANIRKSVGEDKWNRGKYELAAEMFEKVSLSEECPEFLTSVAYDHID